MRRVGHLASAGKVAHFDILECIEHLEYTRSGPLEVDIAHFCCGRTLAISFDNISLDWPFSRLCTVYGLNIKHEILRTQEIVTS